MLDAQDTVVNVGDETLVRFKPKAIEVVARNVSDITIKIHFDKMESTLRPEGVILAAGDVLTLTGTPFEWIKFFVDKKENCNYT